MMLTHKQAILEINTFVHSPALLFMTGIMTLVAGLALVPGHHLW